MGRPIAGLLCRILISLENYDDAIPLTLSPLGNPCKCYTVLKRLSAFGAVINLYVQFGRKEPFKMTVKNHTATMLPPTLRILHVTFT